MRYTPGPWKVSINSVGQRWVESGEENIALCIGENEQATANARLIAAAPDLVEALDQLQRNLSKAWPRGDRSGFEQALLDTIDQALAKCNCREGLDASA